MLWEKKGNYITAQDFITVNKREIISVLKNVNTAIEINIIVLGSYNSYHLKIVWHMAKKILSGALFLS